MDGLIDSMKNCFAKKGSHKNVNLFASGQVPLQVVLHRRFNHLETIEFDLSKVEVVDLLLIKRSLSDLSPSHSPSDSIMAPIRKDGPDLEHVSFSIPSQLGRRKNRSTVRPSSSLRPFITRKIAVAACQRRARLDGVPRSRTFGSRNDVSNYPSLDDFPHGCLLVNNQARWPKEFFFFSELELWIFFVTKFSTKF